jgi:hypothetical protein
MHFNKQAYLKGRGACVDDQIWQVWENRTIQFPISEYPVLAGSGETQGQELNLKIQGILRHEK